MSVYPPPIQINSIFNPYNYSSLNDTLTRRQANQTYLIKTGADTDYGTITMKQPIYLADGTFSAPSLSFDLQKNLGFYRSAADTLGFSTNGTEQMTISTLAVGTILRMESNQFRSKSSFGTAGNVLFGSNNNQGLYFGLNQVSVSTNSTERLRVIDTRTIAYTPFTLPDASVTTPSIHFNSSVSSGIYYGGANQVAVSSNGIQVAGFDTSGLKLYNSTSGYVPTGLNYYEEVADINCTWTYGSVSVSVPIRLTRIGRQVFCQITTDLNFSANVFFAFNVVSTANIVPARFRPNNVCCFASTWSNRNAIYDNFLCFIELNGTINLWQRAYTGSNATAYIWAFSGTWSL